MKKEIIKKIIYGIFVIIWMATVFNFSSEQSTKSTSTSETVIRAGLSKNENFKKLNESEQKTIIEKYQHPIRKLAHFTLYAIGGLLIFNFLNTFNTCTRNKMLIAIIIGLSYAISDEIHQLFTDGRSAQITDVLIDTAGATLGCTIMYTIKKIISKVYAKA